ncbi:ABC transporter permease [Mycoplasma sp. E35C]|uniref:ABC transporter permease n=1 Tax=Mycoplasma sp. E35C TaxID=2801918 RepID=UPI001CA3CB5A|nr:ABC transporter permease [Mycoplasma sp. E35C]QZX48974.1 hypothetical protein JJE79_02870 [Mycoplasma sp. E35C]
MYIIPILGFIIILVAGLVLRVVDDAALFKTVLIAPVLATLLFNVFYSTNSAIVIFKSMESEGAELLISSKPVSRKANILSKIGYLFIIALLSAIVSFIAFNSGLAGSSKTSLLPSYFYYSLIASSFFVSFFCFLTFGLITALISIKLNRRIAYFLMPSLFLPLFLIGNMSGYFSDTAINSFSTNMYNSQNLVSFYNTSTINNNDEILFIPKNNKKEFSDTEKDFINKTNYQKAKDNSIIFRFMTWLNVPLQFGLGFSENGADFLNTRSIYSSSLLKNTLNYSNNDDLRYSYRLFENQGLNTLVETPSDLINSTTANNTSPNPDVTNSNPDSTSTVTNPSLTTPNPTNSANNTTNQPEMSYLFPNLPLTSNNEIIYAWDKANTEKIIPQDSFGFSVVDTYAGRIKWDIVEESLRNQEAKQFFASIIKDHQNNTYEEFIEFIHENLQEFLNVYKFGLNVKFNKLNDQEKQIYLYTLFLYQLFFLGNPNSTLFKDALPKLNNKQIDVKLMNNEIYHIGGYSDYRPVLRRINNPEPGPSSPTDNGAVQEVSRLELDTAIDKNLFTNIKNFYSVKRVYDAAPTYGLVLFWLVIDTVLLISVYFIYTRREFK